MRRGGRSGGNVVREESGGVKRGIVIVAGLVIRKGKR